MHCAWLLIGTLPSPSVHHRVVNCEVLQLACVCVCLSVCLSAHISHKAHVQLHKMLCTCQLWHSVMQTQNILCPH